jgi:hypothetical protein
MVVFFLFFFNFVQVNLILCNKTSNHTTLKNNNIIKIIKIKIKIKNKIFFQPKFFHAHLIRHTLGRIVSIEKLKEHVLISNLKHHLGRGIRAS